MLAPGINPHRLRLAGPRKAAFLEEPDRPSVGDQDVHVEGLVPASQPAQDLGADPTAAEVGDYSASGKKVYQRRK
jgi:hypothetical protein